MGYKLSPSVVFCCPGGAFARAIANVGTDMVRRDQGPWGAPGCHTWQLLGAEVTGARGAGWADWCRDGRGTSFGHLGAEVMAPRCRLGPSGPA
ncbi:hypothetical protein V6N13_003348 [Hibiscus sabdariffa]|uniref:Uncharacterized protein n=1 Tax=Hibiscus sabdariffa TaxID=183260 RepID=A0ABR2NRS5_9ROSI